MMKQGQHFCWLASYSMRNLHALSRKEAGMAESSQETWATGDAYEQYVGRWSRVVAKEFLKWLDVEAGLVWGEVGCGSGALVGSILDGSSPRSIAAVDRSESFLRTARAKVNAANAHFAVSDAQALAWASNFCDATVSGLVLNFVKDPQAMVAEMVRVTRPGGSVALYVWDYRDGMQMMRHFWDAAIEINPHDATLDESERFPICQPEPLEALFRGAGLSAVAVRAIAIPTVFRDFNDYWTPFLSKQGPAPTYLARLDAAVRDQIRSTLQSRLVPSADGSITMTARAWAVKGKVSYHTGA
jgi:SAM-dependent methyltransferase